MSSWQRRAWGQLLTSHVILSACGLLALLLLLGVGFSCSDTSEEASAGPFATDTVLMIVLEGVSPEDLTRYALQSDKMPALANFAKESTWFERHWAQSNGTNAAFASLLSGVYSSKHGLGSVSRNGREGLSSEATLISEDLSAAGFDCIASVGTPSFSGEFSGFDQGWSKYECSGLAKGSKWRSVEGVVDTIWGELEVKLESSAPVFGLIEFGKQSREALPDRLLAPALLEFLAPFGSELSSLSVHLEAFRSGSHDGTEALRKLLIRRRGHPAYDALNQAYDQACFQFIDEQIARLFDLLAEHDRYSNALIVVTGSIGRGYRDGDAHAPVLRFNLDRMRVPLVLRLPGGEHLLSVDALTQAIDVRATIADALGLPCHDSDGVSLLPTLVDREAAPIPHESVFFEDSFLGVVGAVDDFWLVQNRPGISHVALDDSRAELQGDDIPPVPKATLRRTEVALKAFMGGNHVQVELAQGAAVVYTVGVDRFSGVWLGGTVWGDKAYDTSSPESITSDPASPPSHWSGRVKPSFECLVATNELEGTSAGFALRADQDAPTFALSIKSSSDSLDESRLVFGDRDLAQLALPRLPNRSADEWPKNPDGTSIEPIVDVARESGRWLGLRVAGESGRKVRLLIVGEARGEPGRTELKVRASDEYTMLKVAGRADCMWVDGETPLLVSFEAPSAWRLGLSVAIEGKQVSIQDMRFLGRQFDSVGSISLAVMDWLPGVREHLDAKIDSSQISLDPGMLRVRCFSKRQHANDTLISDEELRGKVHFLGLIE